MIKYLSGRVKRTPQDRLSEDRYDYLDVKQAEPNLADPATSPPVPSGSQFQLVAVPGYPGRRYWVPIGGGLIPGAISVFDEGTIVGTANSITQLNFVGAAVTARVSVQSPSGHPGVAATVTVIPATIQDNPPLNPNPGELWWESDTGDLFIYYQDADTAQWVTTNTGGRGDPGEKGQKGQKGEIGSQGLTGGVGDEGDKGEKGQKGDKGEKGQKGQKGEVEEKGNKGEKGDKGQKGDKGEKGQKGEKGEKGQKGEKGEKGEKGQKGTDGIVGSQGDKAGLRYQYSHNTSMNDPGTGIFKYNNSSTLGSISAIAIDAQTKEGTDVSDFIATWDDSSNNTIKGHIIVTSNVNADATYSIFEVTSVTDNTGWLQITVQNPVGNFPSNGEECVINFSRTGDKGEKGQKGEVGSKGQKGEIGSKGQKGEVGQKGQKGEGDKGQKGEDNSTKGQKGEDNSSKGQKGEPGDKGQKGDGDKGQKGEGDKGQKGESDKGQKGEEGDKGQKGSANALTYNNAGNDRVITSHDASTIHAETNMTFNDTNGLYVNNHIEATGRIRPSVGNAGDRGIYWATDPGGGAGDAAWIRYYVQSGENTRLEIGISNDADDDVTLTGGTIRLNSGTTVANGGFRPNVNASYDLGSSSYRWNDLYVNDLALSNESKKDTGGNDVDGTWGDWRIQEGENDLFLINNRNGKKYRFLLKEID